MWGSAHLVYPLPRTGSDSGGGSGFDLVAAALLRGSIRRPGLQNGARPPLVVIVVTGGGWRGETPTAQTRLEDHMHNTSSVRRFSPRPSAASLSAWRV